MSCEEKQWKGKKHANCKKEEQCKVQTHSNYHEEEKAIMH
jgi:hypothetical protein